MSSYQTLTVLSTFAVLSNFWFFGTEVLMNENILVLIKAAYRLQLFEMLNLIDRRECHSRHMRLCMNA